MEDAMSMLMIHCPETSHAVLTGLEVDDGLQSLADVAYETDCPLCGGKHVWWKKSASLVEPPRRRNDAVAVSRALQGDQRSTAMTQPQLGVAVTEDGHINFVIESGRWESVILSLNGEEAEELIEDLRDARCQLTIQNE
jgi:hypothetical protein